MSLDGPCEGRPGDMLTYTVAYEVFRGPGTDAAIIWSDPGITYVSSRLLSGSGQLAWQTTDLVRWSVDRGNGVLEVTLQIPQHKRSGTFHVFAFEPGTGTSQSNTLTVTIVP